MIGFLILLVQLAAGLWFFRIFARWEARRAVLRRFPVGGEPVDHDAPDGQRLVSDGRLARWLSLAGLRGPRAVVLFLTLSAGAVVLGAASGVLYHQVVRPPLLEFVRSIPGSTGETFAAILEGGGWFVLVATSLVPVLYVRNARRRRVEDIERDLPLALDLFSTMAEAGLSFDSALSRIVASQPAERPLTRELASFQRDVLAGTPRLHALRRLSERVDVAGVAIFTSAVIHAEQVGASMADTLRNQAESLRARRREQALLHAQAMPVRLVFPLVVCFLPGIFLSTLAPVLYQLTRVADSVLRSPAR